MKNLVNLTAILLFVTNTAIASDLILATGSTTRITTLPCEEIWDLIDGRREITILDLEYEYAPPPERAAEISAKNSLNLFCDPRKIQLGPGESWHHENSYQCVPAKNGIKELVIAVTYHASAMVSCVH